MANDAEAMVASVLTGRSFPVIQGPERPAPDAAIFVYLTGGLPPLPEQGRGTVTKLSTVTALVRGEPGDYATMHAEALAVWDQIDRVKPSGAVIVEHTMSDPVPLGFDAENRFRFAVNVVVYNDQTPS